MAWKSKNYHSELTVIIGLFYRGSGGGPPEKERSLFWGGRRSTAVAARGFQRPLQIKAQIIDMLDADG